MLNGRTILVTGIATDDSIARAVAATAHQHGATVIATAFPRDCDAARTVLDAIDPAIRLDPLDLTDQDQLRGWSADLRGAGVELSGAVHAVAFSPPGALAGTLSDADPNDVERAFRTSVWTYAALGRVLADLKAPGDASLVGLDFDAGGRAWPTYNWMGVAKGALRETSRYLARDYGTVQLRSNLVAAGPLLTRAARAIPRFDLLLDAWHTSAPLAWNPGDPQPVADAVCFLLSDLARAISGEVLHVDGGFHAMATSRPLAD